MFAGLLLGLALAPALQAKEQQVPPSAASKRQKTDAASKPRAARAVQATPTARLATSPKAVPRRAVAAGLNSTQIETQLQAIYAAIAAANNRQALQLAE